MAHAYSKQQLLAEHRTKIYYNQLRIDYSRLVFSDQVDPERGYLNTPSAFAAQNDGKKNYLDIDAGATLGFTFFKTNPMSRNGQTK